MEAVCLRCQEVSEMHSFLTERSSQEMVCPSDSRMYDTLRHG